MNEQDADDTTDAGMLNVYKEGEEPELKLPMSDLPDTKPAIEELSSVKFDGKDAGKKPLPPKRPAESARSAIPSARAAVTYAVPKTEPIHSYAVVFRFKSNKIKSNNTVTLLTINATDLDGAEYALTLSMVPGHEVCGWGCYWQNPAFEYSSPIGGVATSHGISSNDTMYDDGAWHEVALSHFWANQSTNLFIDGCALSRFIVYNIL